MKMIIGFLILGYSLFVSHFFIISLNEKEIESNFLPIYSSFVFEGKKRGINLENYGLSINMVSESLNRDNQKGVETLGHCSVLLYNKPKVSISEVLWNKASNIEKEMILFHELGHGLLLKGHTNTENSNKKSLMNKFIFSEKTYIENREYYLDELFGYKTYHIKDYVDTFFFNGSIYSFTKKIEGFYLLRRF